MKFDVLPVKQLRHREASVKGCQREGKDPFTLRSEDIILLRGFFYE